MSVYEIRCGSVDYFGRGAVDKLSLIIEKFISLGMKRVGVVTGRASYKKSGAWERVVPCLEKSGVEYVHYDGISPNPTTGQADTAVEEFAPFSPDLLLAIGGGSVIDATKVISILLLHPEMKAKDLFIKRDAPEKAIPIIAINLTHGTGSEVDRYAVLTVEEIKKKSGAASDAMYPKYAIDDPELMLSLPRREVLFTSLDALNHLIEASTTTLSSPYTRMIAKEGVKIIYECLPKALNNPHDIEVKEKLLYASILGGIAIDCSVVHLT
ncbi:MAG: iron-containing alcohol dehydrogenase, partial [Nitrospirae bacterium]